jgi:hypothetical protein
VRIVDGMPRRIFRGNTFEQVPQGWSVPGIARKCAAHLVKDSLDFTHDRTPEKT